MAWPTSVFKVFVHHQWGEWPGPEERIDWLGQRAFEGNSAGLVITAVDTVRQEFRAWLMEGPSHRKMSCWRCGEASECPSKHKLIPKEEIKEVWSLTSAPRRVLRLPSRGPWLNPQLRAPGLATGKPEKIAASPTCWLQQHLTQTVYRGAQRSCVSWLPSTGWPSGPSESGSSEAHQTHLGWAARKALGRPNRGGLQPTSYTIGPESSTSHLGWLARPFPPSPVYLSRDQGSSGLILPGLPGMVTSHRPCLSPHSHVHWAPHSWFLLSAAAPQLRITRKPRPRKEPAFRLARMVTSLPLVPLSLYQDNRRSLGPWLVKKWKEAPGVIPRKRSLESASEVHSCTDRKGMCPMPQDGQNWNHNG